MICGSWVVVIINVVIKGWIKNVFFVVSMCGMYFDWFG